MSETRDIPDSWIKVTLNDICLTSSGGTPSRKNSSFYNGNIPWVKSGELKYNTILTSEEKINQEAIDKSSAKLVPKGTLLIALYGATVGRMAFLGVDAATNQAVASIKCFSKMSNKFIYYYLFSRKEELLQKRIGGAQPNISQKILNKLAIFLPPLFEQHRIVDTIEELFSDLDNGVANLKLAQNQLKVYRQALLKHAFEGKLTEQWRKDNNPESAEQLLEHIKEERNNRYEQELKEWKEAVKIWEKEGKEGEKPRKAKKPVFRKGISDLRLIGLPSKWKWNSVGNISELVSGQHIMQRHYNNKGKGIPYLTGPSDFGDKYPLITKWTSSPKAMAIVGEILITVKGSGVGKINLTNQNVAIGRQLMTLKPYVNNLYTYYYFESKRDVFEKVSTGTAIPGIGREQILDFQIPICSKSEQTLIVQSIESQISIIDNLEQTINLGIHNSKALRQSILKKAFEGMLVTQNSQDESASDLLKRIQAEKKKYLEEQKQQKKKAPKKIKTMSKSLIQIIETKFESKEFTYDDLRNETSLTYEDLKNQLFELLEKGDRLKSSFDKTVEEIKYTISK